jgi:hypothetical protein
MKRVLISAFATAAIALGAATPALAAAEITQCMSGSSCVSGTTNVNLGDFTNTTPVTGTVGIGGPLVTFTSTQGNLSTNSGAATIFRPDGVLTNLTFSLAAGFSFTAAEFNLLTGTSASFDITLHTAGGPDVILSGVKLTGSNVFDIVAPAGSGESYTGATFTTEDGSGFDTFKQLRLVLASTGAVPEPATWAMMLVGFGGIGMAMRRSRRRKPALAQVA